MIRSAALTAAFASSPSCTEAPTPDDPTPNVAVARDFARHLSALLRDEQAALVTFLLALAECDGRRLWAALGYASLFDFLHRELGLSRSAAYYRSAAAWLVQRYPEIGDALADGRICLTTLAEIGKVITPENAREILPRFFHRSTREAKEVVAELAPTAAPALREVVTILPSLSAPSVSRLGSSEPAHGFGPAHAGSSPTTGMTAPANTVAPEGSAALDPSHLVQALGQEMEASQTEPLPTCGRAGSAEAPLPAHPPAGAPSLAASASARAPATEVQALTSDLRRIHITVTKRWLEKLEAAKAALSHSIPSGSAEAVLDAALDALLAREARRSGLVEKPRRPRQPRAAPESAAVANDRTADGAASNDPVPTAAAASRRAANDAGSNGRVAIPAHVRREVLRRDQGRCQARLHDGTICGSTVRLQFDHIHPVALGGPSTAENLRLLCARHNQLAAREVFGEAWMDSVATRSP